MSKLLLIWDFLHTHINKYILVIGVFIFYILFLDENSLMHRMRLTTQQRELKKEIKYYRDKIEQDAKKLEELHSSDENLEKFAREQYLMKQPDEEIFIIK
ncbi:MAG: septum formation initiator family protein [Bacteroidales bacterium]|jgi:cell division protein DivIC|nr:septum formation initiator family protein [Bacteroidales bacterium]MDD3160836.1 septum formation initiator family protein [Bacteroidales bacterium]